MPSGMSKGIFRPRKPARPERDLDAGLGMDVYLRESVAYSAFLAANAGSGDECTFQDFLRRQRSDQTVGANPAGKSSRDDCVAPGAEAGNSAPAPELRKRFFPSGNGSPRRGYGPWLLFFAAAVLAIGATQAFRTSVTRVERQGPLLEWKRMAMPAPIGAEPAPPASEPVAGLESPPAPPEPLAIGSAPAPQLGDSSPPHVSAPVVRVASASPRITGRAGPPVSRSHASVRHPSFPRASAKSDRAQRSLECALSRTDGAPAGISRHGDC